MGSSSNFEIFTCFTQKLFKNLKTELEWFLEPPGLPGMKIDTIGRLAY